MKYYVSIAVDGRVSVVVDAVDPAEAKYLAYDAFLDTNLGEVDVVGYKAVNAEDEQGNLTDY